MGAGAGEGPRGLRNTCSLACSGIFSSLRLNCRSAPGDLVRSGAAGRVHSGHPPTAGGSASGAGRRRPLVRGRGRFRPHRGGAVHPAGRRGVRLLRAPGASLGPWARRPTAAALRLAVARRPSPAHRLIRFSLSSVLVETL